MTRPRTPWRIGRLAPAVIALAATLLVACATRVAIDEATTLARAGRNEEALALLAGERARNPSDEPLRAAELRLRESTVAQYVLEAESARAADRLADATAALRRAQALDAQHPRVVALATMLDRAQRRSVALRAAQEAESAGRVADAEALVNRLLGEWPGDTAARELQRRLRERRPPAAEPPLLGAAMGTRVNLEFRDAPLRSVLEGLGRTHGLNFVFDRDVRADSRINVLLRDTPLAEGLRIIFSTHQLAGKTLNERTLLVYPDTAAKRSEHRELVTRSFYLANADVKQAQALVRTMAKTKDVFVDERLNQLIVRDTPEVMRLVERLLAGIDTAEPEVVLEVEVLEIASTRLTEAGIDWPSQISYGLPGVTGAVPLSQADSFRSSIANPALVASLRETVTRANTLANPRLRARNRDKAKVTVGEKLPVFTTTTNANGSSATVSYLDVGLKLEVEPNVLLEGDVVMKVALEVSTLISKVSGPQGAVGYQVGTREASTTLRLRDGETQILAGLIRDEDTKSIAGLPGLSSMPVLGRLFGLHSDGRNKTEIVLLITPRVVRAVVPPEQALVNTPAGSELSPGDAPLRLSERSAVSVPVRAARGPGAASGAAASAPATGAAAAALEALPAGAESGPKRALLLLSGTASTSVGAVATVTLSNRSDSTMEGELQFDATLLQPAQSGAGGGGRASFKLEPGGEQVVPLRVLQAAAGQSVTVSLGGVSARDARGEPVPVQTDGEVTIVVGR